MNIVLITCDSLRYDRLSCNGYSRLTSPSIDRFSKQAHQFSHAFSNGPNTPHAFPAIFASRCSLMSNRFGLFGVPKTLPEILKENGYQTYGFNAANPYVSRYFRYDRGFDFFQDYLNFDVSPETSNGHNNAVTETSFITIPGLDMEHYLVSEENVRAKAELENMINVDIFHRLERNQDRPFFLWVHYMDTHYPYLPQNEAQDSLKMATIPREENLRINQAVRENIPLSTELLQKANRLYDAAVRQLDTKIGKLLEFLKLKNLYDESLIVFTADHGEEFMEHGDLQHKSKLYDELLHVPLLIKQPFQKEPKLNSNLVSLLQLAPTILSESNCENPFLYRSIFPSLNDAEKLECAMVFSAASFGNGNGTPVGNDMSRLNYMPKRFSCRTQTHKIIMETGGIELGFNLLNDPAEQVNMGIESQGLEKLRNTLVEYTKSTERFQISHHVERLKKSFAF